MGKHYFGRTTQSTVGEYVGIAKYVLQYFNFTLQLHLIITLIFTLYTSIDTRLVGSQSTRELMDPLRNKVGRFRDFPYLLRT